MPVFKVICVLSLTFIFVSDSSGLRDYVEDSKNVYWLFKPFVPPRNVHLIKRLQDVANSEDAWLWRYFIVPEFIPKYTTTTDWPVNQDETLTTEAIIEKIDTKHVIDVANNCPPGTSLDPFGECREDW